MDGNKQKKNPWDSYRSKEGKAAAKMKMTIRQRRRIAVLLALRQLGIQLPPDVLKQILKDI